MVIQVGQALWQSLLSLLDLLSQRSILSMEVKGVNDSTSVKYFSDRLKSRLAEMQKELEDDEQLEAVAFLPSGAAFAMDAVGCQSPALSPTLKGYEQVLWK
jgi:hypothetical protein